MNDLREDTLAPIGRDFFERARFGAPTGGVPRLEEVLTRLASGDLDYKFFGQVLGILHAESLGLRPPSSSPATLARYRRLARNWGLSATDLDSTAGAPVVLDYHSGRTREVA